MNTKPLRRVLTLGLLVLLACPTAFATVQSFKNESCAETDSCALKEFSLTHENYEVIAGGGDNYGTRAFALYKTARHEDLEKFGFAQQIRGCVFMSCQSADGSVTKALSYVHSSFGKEVRFRHPTWIVDSDDVDPMYNSTAEVGKSRHDIYRWNTVEGSFAKPTQRFFGRERPVRSELYVSDRPGVAFYTSDDRCAQNISLEFKMCIYKSAEIPLVSIATRLDFARPLHCFDWSSSFVFDHLTGKFLEPVGLDPICQ